MKYLIHKDNYDFWIRACNRAIGRLTERLDKAIVYYESLGWLRRLIAEHLIKIHEELVVKFTGYKEKFFTRSTAVCMTDSRIKYILSCADIYEEYRQKYQKEKDKVLFEI